MKRNTKKTGMDDTKLDALKKLKEARMKGISREVEDEVMDFENNKNIFNEKMDDFIDDDGKDHGYTFDISDEELEAKKIQKFDKKSILNFLPHMAAKKSDVPIKKDKALIKKADNLMSDLFDKLDEDEIGDISSRPKINDLMEKQKLNNDERKLTISDYKNVNKKDFSNLVGYQLNPSIAPSIKRKIDTSINDKFLKSKQITDEYMENYDSDKMEIDDENEDKLIKMDNNPSIKNENKIPGRQIKHIQKEVNSSQKRDRQEQNSDIKISDRKITDAFHGRTTVNSNNSSLNNKNSTPQKILSANFTPNKSLNPNEINPDNSTPNPKSFEINNSNTSTINQNSNRSGGISIRNSKQEPIPLNQDGSLFVYWIDMSEEKENNNELVVIYGKIFDPTSQNKFSSISLVIKNMNRILQIIPKENKATNTKFSLKEVREEFEELRKTKFAYITNYKTRETNRKYCFELPIEHGEYNILEIQYNANQGIIPHTISGKTFDYIFGKQSSLSETVLIESIIRGPCWLKIEKNGFSENKNSQYSNTKFEVHIENFKKNISVLDVNNFLNNPNGNEANNSFKYLLKTPPLTIMSISIKTIQNKDNNQLEIYGICGMVIERFLLEDEKNENEKQNIIPFLAIRKIDHPSIKFDDMEKIKNSNCFKGSIFSVCQNETAVINQFVNKVSVYDPDVIVSHRSFEQMDLILNRISKLKISAWSKISRFRKEKLPKFLQTQNQNSGASNASGNFLVRNCTVGRLLCDMELNCRAYIKESSYELEHLVKSVLKIDLIQYDATKVFSKDTENQILQKKYSEKFDNIALNDLKHNDLVDLVRNLINSIYLESVYSFYLMNKLSILPLTKELTVIGGNLWIKSLQNTRADRCEMLLMHEFHSRNYILPDKLSKFDKEDYIEENDFEDLDEKNIGTKISKKKPKYSGGLVLEPIADLYDDIVLLLDFNSLYPSIIQEYNICFTTINRKPTQKFFNKKNTEDNNNKKDRNKKLGKDSNIENEEELKEDDQLEDIIKEDEDINKFDLSIIRKIEEKSILPGILESLVKKRKGIKEKMKFEKDPFKKDLLEIQQKAIKLSANSLYGYLGFGNSRFHAKAIAALITSIGRNILQNTVDMVKRKHELDVIYGDTDSIMINTKLKDITAAIVLGQTIKKSVNEKYKLLEMEMDGIFKTLLLLKKKKYAALKYEPPFGKDSVLAKEFKGLDLVRRDWCELSKQVGLYILDIILSGKNKEDISVIILDFLGDIRKNLSFVNEDNSESNTNTQDQNINIDNQDHVKYSVQMFEIIKSLSKKLEDYEKNASLPHVKVARRLMNKGDYSLKTHSLIPYIICNLKEGVEVDDNSPEPIRNLKKNKNLNEKAFHRTELEEYKEYIKIDVEWYKSNQIIAPVRRLCKHISQLEMHQLAHALGLDTSKYNFSKGNENENENFYNENIFTKNESKGMLKVKSKQGLKLKCFHCEKEKTIENVYSFEENIAEIYKCDNCKQMNDKEYDNYLHNKILIQNKMNLLKYYNLEKTCSKCKSNTKMFLINKCLDVNCKKSMLKQTVHNEETFNEIKFLYNLLGCGVQEKELEIEKKKMMIVDLLKRNERLRKMIKETYHRTDYNFVELGDIFNCLNFDEN